MRDPMRYAAGTIVGNGIAVARWALVMTALLSVCMPSTAIASEAAVAVERNYVMAEAAPARQTAAAVAAKSAGCLSCHTASDAPSMHDNPGVRLGCTDCHGGDPTVFAPAGTHEIRAHGDSHAQADAHPQGESGDAAGGHGATHGAAAHADPAWVAARDGAHVLPTYPSAWHFPSSANPERTYTLLNREAREYIRFVNPSDFRVAELACGACHQPVIEASIRSMHATGAMLWGGAAYNNGILPFKNYLLGESYTEDGVGSVLYGPELPEEAQAAAAAKGILPVLYPLPAWETIKPGDIFRVFERGGRNLSSLFPETGIPNSLGLIQRLEEPGRPDIRQSNRGPGTGARISVPVINITKTRLNDPFLWFMGTNDQPGDYRHSGCAACHVVYANDRDPRHSGPYAQFGHTGTTQTADPMIPADESGHPLQHRFTRAVPTSQCMICHMHQPNMFMNTYLGYTMWDYESDAPHMWPEQQVYPTHEQRRQVLDRNPEGAAPRGKWADVEFLKGVWEMNDQLSDTQFADYHGHGWNFRAIFKRDRKGNLLDAAGAIVSDDDPDKFDKAVHLSSIHVDVGMHCVDCHFAQDNHGNGHIHGEVALAVEIDCKDCHGSATTYPNLYTSGPAALEGGTDLAALRTPDGRRRFEWRAGALWQRSMLDPDREWKLSLVKDTVDPAHDEYNAKAARAKLMGRDVDTQAWGPEVTDLAHADENMECYACHTSWTTSCGGCHLPIEANNKTERHHYEGGISRNYATYNPQVARDQIFMLGRRGPQKGGKIAPVRSTSALVLSSTNANREKIYIQQPPVAASGFSSQAMNPHFPHTVRKTETRVCDDCHVAAAGDNNAIMAQTLMFGTDFIDLLGYNAWVGGDGEITAVQVTEWDEPQAVIGSYLHRYAYPDWFAEHQQRGLELPDAHTHRSKRAQCLQLRGEYLFVANGERGLEVFDVANIANKGYSQRVISAPFSPLGHDTRVDSENATCMALSTTQPVHPDRNQGELMRVTNQEQPFHPTYAYVFVVDAVEGLILVDYQTLADGEPRNNQLERALTWNPDGVLTGARHITLGGYYAYVLTDDALVILNLDEPLQPVVAARLPLDSPTFSALQFRYLFVTDARGLVTVDVTDPAAPRLIEGSRVKLAHANAVAIARTYAYVAAGSDGLVIIDVERPTAPREFRRFDADGRIVDARDVTVATTNASLFAYVADGVGGLKVVQLTSPELQPKFYGFSPEPNPRLIAQHATGKPALGLSRALERDRGVDETGGQVAIFGRKGSRPLVLEEMRRLYLKDGRVWTVENDPATARAAAATAAPATTTGSSGGDE